MDVRIDGACTGSELRMGLLGVSYVLCGSKPVVIPRRQTRALAFYLANQLEPVSRGTLTALFWPDVSESVARLHLSHLLTHLSMSIGVKGALLIEGDVIAFNKEKVWSDTVALQMASRGSNTMQELAQVVALYRGSFLEGFSLPTNPEFEQWIVSTRSAWERLHLYHLKRLLLCAARCGDLDTAITGAHEYLSLDDLDEEVHAILAILYTASGKRSMALQELENCAEIFNRELGVTSLTSLKGLSDAVRNGEVPSLLDYCHSNHGHVGAPLNQNPCYWLKSGTYCALMQTPCRCAAIVHRA